MASFEGTAAIPYFLRVPGVVNGLRRTVLLRSSDWIDSVDPTNEPLEAVFSVSPNPSSYCCNGSFRNCDIKCLTSVK